MKRKTLRILAHVLQLEVFEMLVVLFDLCLDPEHFVVGFLKTDLVPERINLFEQAIVGLVPVGGEEGDMRILVLA